MTERSYQFGRRRRLSTDLDSLPRDETSAGSIAILPYPVGPPGILSGLSVLVVEDDIFILDIIGSFLTNLGCTSIVRIETIDRALEVLDTHHFDAATLDGTLHGRKTYAVADKLTARDVPFFFATGDKDHGMKDGYRRHLVLMKPFAYPAMADMFLRLLAGVSIDHRVGSRSLPKSA